MQDYPYSPEKGEHVFRIAVVGDSFTFAPFMQFTDSFTKKLESKLNINHTARKAEVINYGVPAYSTSHEVSKVEQAIREQADVVVLQITLNDPEIKGPQIIGITNFSNFGAFQPGPILARILRHWHSLRFVLERLHNTETERAYREYFLDLFENPKTRKPFERAMSSIAKQAHEAHVPLIAVVFPLFGMPLDSSYPFYSIHRQVVELMNSLQVPVLDISPLYQGIPLERLQVIPGIDRHPNEIGHRMAAERIYQWLEELKLLPEELVIRKKYKKRTQIVKEEPYTG